MCVCVCVFVCARACTYACTHVWLYKQTVNICRGGRECRSWVLSRQRSWVQSPHGPVGCAPSHYLRGPLGGNPPDYSIVHMSEARTHLLGVAGMVNCIILLFYWLKLDWIKFWVLLSVISLKKAASHCLCCTLVSRQMESFHHFWWLFFCISFKLGSFPSMVHFAVFFFFLTMLLYMLVT